MTEEEHQRLLLDLRADRWLAHRLIFAHRHPDESPEAHRDLVAAINRPVARLSIEGFRGVAKTTYTEETAILKAVYREFHNMVIIGPSFPRACDRVDAIKNEILVNPYLADYIDVDEEGKKFKLFGDLKGADIWQDGKIVLANGVCIQALGRDQSITGLKFRQWRPDAFLIDDIEDPEEKRTDIEREETWRWLKQTFQPSLDDPLLTWGRFLGTRRGKNSLPERLESDGMPVVKFPIESVGAHGERVATWPSKFPLTKIDQLRYDYRGDMGLYAQEYMCEVTSAADRVFKREMFRVEPQVKTWQATYAMIDPARSIKETSDLTGWAVWSWVKNRLFVWAADGSRLLPDEIVALGFDLAERFDPIKVGFEKTGLEQWLMQLIRAEQTKRGTTIPCEGIPAVPQIPLIKSMQPLFGAGEVIFAQELPALVSQLLSFPHGKRDIANALAYAMVMRPGRPIYDGFMLDHIVEDLGVRRDHPVFLAANAKGGMTTGVLVQAFDGMLRILDDWVFEGSPIERVPDLYQAEVLSGDTARLADVPRPWDDALKQMPDRLILRRVPPVWIVPMRHADRYMNTGLIQAVKALPAEVRVGGTEVAGSLYMKDLLSRMVRGVPAVEISSRARWTLRALSGGYTRVLVRGQLQENAEEGPYRVLIEGLEAFCGSMRAGRAKEDLDDEATNWGYSRTGQRYVSAMPQHEKRGRL